MSEIDLGRSVVGNGKKTYFIADIAANHDGDLERAKKLIYLAKQSGADAAKFQNFNAEKIVSDYGFKNLKVSQAHQKSWKKTVFEVYKDYSIPMDWTPILKKECDRIGIDYFSTPYDVDSVDMLDEYVDFYKIGSGDITWLDFLEYVASKGKPIMIGAGASTLEDVKRAVKVISKTNDKIILMQCNTNYTVDIENLKYINLNVLSLFRQEFPKTVLGLSDHTLGDISVLGAVALGAKVIEKHFTDDNQREGPDHKFAMNPVTWKTMVERTKMLERTLGDGIKKVEENEKNSIVVQQRSLRARRDICEGEVLSREDIVALRPAPGGSIKPFDMDNIIGKQLLKDLVKGDFFKYEDLK